MTRNLCCTFWHMLSYSLFAFLFPFISIIIKTFINMYEADDNLLNILRRLFTFVNALCIVFANIDALK